LNAYPHQVMLFPVVDEEVRQSWPLGSQQWQSWVQLDDQLT